jgi:acetyl-CoA carboxylase biotin carboxyl carrier protein
LTFEQIKELIDIVCKRGLQGIELERSDFRLKIKGQVRAATQSLPPDVEAEVAIPAASANNPADSSDSDDQRGSEESKEIGAGEHVISSPIVGTFYAAPSPDSEPYVQVGDRVRQGQVLCIVEAMKLMNEIESDVDGEIVKILGRNAQPVEFGEPLFALRP